MSEQRNAKRVKFRDAADSDLFGKSPNAENLLLCVPPSPPNQRTCPLEPQPAHHWLVSLLPEVGFLLTDIESMFGPAIDTTNDDDFVPPDSLLDAPNLAENLAYRYISKKILRVRSALSSGTLTRVGSPDVKSGRCRMLATGARPVPLSPDDLILPLNQR